MAVFISTEGYLMDLSNMELTKQPDPTEEELLLEAKAWGFDTVEEWLGDMDKAMEQAERDAQSMHELGVIT